MSGLTSCPAYSDLALSTYFHHARALLFPSFEEGYGLPVFSEIAGTIPDYLDPLDGPGWYRRVLDYSAPDSAARAAQLDRLARFQAATWDEHFRRVDLLLGRPGLGRIQPK
ncbi:Glycosyltransferase (fragment) [Magnetospirillum molischianum DSM 120]|uniref:Glycosyltransferase n=1 Tax=Magnetospirillum molischianum DSM 120 TaxID=1150626 RepID=H8FWX1_MAGML